MMSEFQQLVSRISNLEEERNQHLEIIERLEQECSDLTGEVESLGDILIKIVSSSFPELNMDIDLICIKRSIGYLNKMEIKRFPLKLQLEYKDTGKVPSLQEFHENLLRMLNVEEDEKENYPIEISIKFLKERYDTFFSDLQLSVIPEILNKK